MPKSEGRGFKLAIVVALVAALFVGAVAVMNTTSPVATDADPVPSDTDAEELGLNGELAENGARIYDAEEHTGSLQGTVSRTGPAPPQRLLLLLPELAAPLRTDS